MSKMNTIVMYSRKICNFIELILNLYYAKKAINQIYINYKIIKNIYNKKFEK